MRLYRHAIFVIFCAGLLPGCTLTRAHIRQADAIVAADTDRSTTCTQTDHCAVPSPLLDAAIQARADSSAQQPVHVVTLLDDSEAAMVARINLIRAARRSIDVQTYIWDDDDTGQLILQELIDAARRGVKVRILADQLFSFGDPAMLDRLARVSPDLEVRLYNPTFSNAHTPPLAFAAGIVCCFAKFNQRMHNKLLLVDNAIGITGGRNYQDRYYNWDDDFDYIDRDVMVGGPAADEMSKSFDVFWNHKRSVPLTRLRDVNWHIRNDATTQPWPTPQYRRPSRVASVQAEAGDDEWIAANLVADTLRTGKVDYFSDLPAKTDKPQQKDAHEFTGHLMHLLSHAQHEVVLQTPYLVMSRRAKQIFEQLHRDTPAPQVIVSTNSLASTDAFAVYALSYKHRKSYLLKLGLAIYEMKPHAQSALDDYQDANDDADDDIVTAVTVDGKTQKRRRLAGTERRPGLFGSLGGRNRPAPLISAGHRFGLHAKSLVVDDSFAMVGSHNFDPRSDHYNTEAGVIVYDQRFASRLRDSILRATQPDNAWVIGVEKPTVPVLGNISEAIGDVSAKLPLFDVWPFRYAPSYELKLGCTPLLSTDPAFYSCYTSVGDFPDVAISPKLIYTRLITAFGAGVKGVL